MGHYTLLQKRSTAYYYRQIVPQDLQSVLGKKEIIKSLGVKDLKEATSKHKAMALEYDALFKRLRNGEPAKDDSNGTPAPLNAATIYTATNSTAKGHGKLLSDVYEKWSPEKAENYKTKQAALLAIKRFEQVHNSIPIGAIESGHLVDFKDWLAKQEGLKGRTQNKQIEIIKSLVSFAHTNNWIKANPLYGLKIKVSENDSEQYEPFDASELETLLLNEDFKQLRKTNLGYFWIILIGLFTGCRVEEICQLLVTDIKEKQGIRYFDINELEAGKSLKTKSSRRLLPIHNSLIQLGLLDYVDTMRLKKSTLLFPNLNPYRDKRSHYFSRWFGKYKKDCGITSGRKVFHSFRHTFKDLCRDASIPKEVHHRLTGHNSSEVGDMYGAGFSITTLNEHLQKIIIPIDLSSMYVPTQQRLNPHSGKSEKPAHDSTAQENDKANDLRNIISLGEAYQRIGKRFAEKWADYDMMIPMKHGKPHIISLKPKLGKNRRGESELHRLSPADIESLPSREATDKEIATHRQIIEYLGKAMASEAAKAVYKLQGTVNWKIVYPSIWNNIKSIPRSYALSAFELHSKGSAPALIFVSVDSGGLDKYMKEFAE